jgi:hypothetical protein
MDTTTMSPDDAVDIIQSASRHSWEAALIAALLLSVVALLVWIFKSLVAQAERRETALWSQAQEREGRLANRITVLETFINDRLMQRLEENTVAKNKLFDAIDRLITALDTRPCFWDTEKQQAVLEAAVSAAVLNHEHKQRRS